jgi:methylmalonyl-CoA/ethylmalonyl-CoA epimerase
VTTAGGPAAAGRVGQLYRVGIAVRDLEASIERVGRVLGIGPTRRFTNPLQSVTCAWFPMGPCVLELLQSTSPDGPVARFIARRGEGLYLLAVQVADLAASTAMLRERGAEVLLSVAEPFTLGGAHNFVHPRSMCGVLVELVDRDSPGTA